MKRLEQVVFLTLRVPWFGSHSGELAMLPHLSRLTKLKIIVAKTTLPRRCLGKLHSAYHGWPPRNQGVSFAELQARLLHRLSSASVLHLLASEDHACFLKLWKAAPPEIISTIHIPVCLWSKEYREAVSRMSSAITYSTADIEEMGSLMARRNVKFIHDGVDADFFVPGPSRDQTPPRIMYGGVHLRNEAMLARVVRRITERWPEVRFDFLVPPHRRNTAALAPLLEHPAVTWHAGLNDEQLRELYQKSKLLLLPMNPSGASTAVVEALACGLPLVTTDVGGIRDYGGGAIYPVVANNDDEAMIGLVEHYLSRPAERDLLGKRCRAFAEEHLAWRVVAQKHLEVYQQLAA
ncbi:MAG: glycosyltransferase family 4 protein [Verrucomicrobiota bacterium]|jgi:glycosyltransferase involved in cell wall biosynthesis